MMLRSEACERNRDPILKVLRQWFTTPGTVLEVGSGTGQHAVHLAQHMPHLQWLATDRAENLSGIREWIEASGLPNLQGPVEFDVATARWPASEMNYVFSSNTAHIMGWPQVQAMFAGTAQALRTGGFFCLYGPFNRDGQFTSESNRAFDAMLRERDPQMGIRDDQALLELGNANNLEFCGDYALPANNRMLVWVKR